MQRASFAHKLLKLKQPRISSGKESATHRSQSIFSLAVTSVLKHMSKLDVSWTHSFGCCIDGVAVESVGVGVGLTVAAVVGHSNVGQVVWV